MKLTSTAALIALLPVLGSGGCESRHARTEFDRQSQVCTLAENNGLLDAAVDACGAALTIAEQYQYAPERISELTFRLGRLERQRGDFPKAEALVRESLAIAEGIGDSAAIAARLVELSLGLAGQSRWLDGAQALERAAPLAGELAGPDRRAAANAFRAYSIRLGQMGDAPRAEQFSANAEKLTDS